MGFSKTLNCDERTVGASITFHHDQDISFTNPEYRSILQIAGSDSTCQWSLSVDGTTGKDPSEVGSLQSASSQRKRGVIYKVCVPAFTRAENGLSLAVRNINVCGC